MHVLMPKTFAARFGMDPQDKDTAVEYVNRLVDRLLE